MFEKLGQKPIQSANILLQKFGVSEYEVENAILSRDPMDQLAIAYNLILDNKRIQDTGEATFYGISVLIQVSLNILCGSVETLFINI